MENNNIFFEKQSIYKSEIDQLLFELIDNSPVDMQLFLKKALFPGRRNRPVLLKTLASINFEPNKEMLDKLCLAIELTHRASIILDDLIDSDVIRRNKPTFHVMMGNDNTILIAHYLIAQAYSIIGSIQTTYSQEIQDSFTNAYQNIIYGELGDIGSLKRNTFFDLYKETSLYKTSALFELVFFFTSAIQFLPDNQKVLFKQIGQKIGEIYQIYNDIYDDLNSDIEERRKKEIYKINLSMMNSIVLDFGSKSDIDFINKLINNGSTKEEMIILKDLLNKQQYFTLANNYANEVMDSLMLLIDQITDSSFKNITKDFAKWVKQKKCWDQIEFKGAGY